MMNQLSGLQSIFSCLIKEFENQTCTHNSRLLMNCLICLSEVHKPETLACCSNTYCFDCISTWMQVRNCCPTCIRTIGEESKNSLLNHGSEQFDNGCLVLENEMRDVMRRVQYLQILIGAKRASCGDYKSRFPKAHLIFVESEMQKVLMNVDIAAMAISENDRVTASTSIQVVTEAILTVEAVLEGETTIDQEHYSSDEDYGEYDYEQEEMHREIKQNQQRRTLARGSKRKA